MFHNEDDCRDPVCKESPIGKIRNSFLSMANQECPLDRDELGLYSWSLLHTFSLHKDKMRGLLEAFKWLYPCGYCRGHFAKDYDKDPPKLESREELTLWVCRQHNYVNTILGKPNYECNYEKLLKRWKTGCDSDQL